MELFMDSIRWTHVIAGFTGLAAFWVPIFARKGGRAVELTGTPIPDALLRRRFQTGRLSTVSCFSSATWPWLPG